MTFRSYISDLHIHIGRDMHGKPVKITGAKNLTLTSILEEASRRKGIDLIGIIDCHVPSVQQEMKQLIATGKAQERPDGGIQFERATLLLGSEIEVYDEHCHGPIHVLCYFPTLQSIQAFSEWLKTRMKNITLSSQRYYGTAQELQHKVKELSGIFIPAHVFTPFKSMYGKGVKRSLTEVFDRDLIDGIELGLSSDTQMADQISELHAYTFLTNSDAHSLGKMAREYQEIRMKEPSFKEFYWALHLRNGRKITKNFAMNPKLGKYHTTVCNHLINPLPADAANCSACGSTKIIKGVVERIQELKDTDGSFKERPPYFYQVPLEYLPKLGPKTLEKLLTTFPTEMYVIHQATFAELTEVISTQLATMIIDMREGKQSIQAGGG